MRRTRFPRWLLVSVGLISVGLGTVGVFVPLLPTTPFLLLAAACFLRSSDRLHDWLLSHRIYGPIIRGFREHRALPMSSKVTILVLSWGAIGTSILLLDSPLRLFLLVPAIGATYAMVRMPTLDPALLAMDADLEAENETG